MDLSQAIGQKLGFLSRRICLLSALAVLSACSSLPQQSEQPAAVAPAIAKTDVEPAPAPVEPVKPLPLTAELTYLILTAEVAAQRGDIIGAAELYDRAAQSVESPSLASRSTQMANFTRDQRRIERALDRWTEVSPDDADIYMLKAPFLLLQGQFDAVPEAVNKALALAPEKTTDYLGRLTDNLSKIVQADTALPLFSKLDVYQQNNTEALYQFGRLATFYKQYDDALPALNKVLEAEPQHDDALILKAKVLQRSGKGEQALDAIRPAATQRDASRFLRFTYGQLLGENNFVDESRLIFERLYQEDPAADIAFALGVIAIEQEQGDKAKQYFNRLLDLGDPGQQAAYFMGVAEKVSGNVDEALSWFSSVPNNNPRFQAAQTHYVTLLADNGALAKARVHLANIRTANPNLAVQYYLFESAFLRERHLKQASYELLDQALTEHPNDIDLLYGRAMAAESIDRIDLLEQDLRAILKIDPKHAQTLNALGYTLTDRTDRHQEALVLINQALELEPNDPFFLDSLGWVYYRLGDLEKAEQYLKQAVAIQTDPEFLAHLGEVLWQRGEQREAKKIWQQGLEYDAENPLLLKTMEQFGL